MVLLVAAMVWAAVSLHFNNFAHCEPQGLFGCIHGALGKS